MINGTHDRMLQSCFNVFEKLSNKYDITCITFVLYLLVILIYGKYHQTHRHVIGGPTSKVPLRFVPGP